MGERFRSIDAIEASRNELGFSDFRILGFCEKINSFCADIHASSCIHFIEPESNSVREKHL